MYIYIIIKNIMFKESINKSNLEGEKVWGIFLPIVYNTSNQLGNSLNIEEHDVELANWKILSKNDIEKYKEKAYQAIVDKYKFDSIEQEAFFKGLTPINEEWKKKFGINFDEVPGHPSWPGICCHKAVRDDTYLAAEIYVNPNVIKDPALFLATLIHELDHHAYSVKKFSKRLLNATNRQQKGIELGKIIREDEEYDNRFSSELLARIDTADILTWCCVTNNLVNLYGIWYQTTWEQFYTDSIKYAKKFFDFQKRLYNVVWNKFGRDSSKPKNKQLSKEAEEEFEDIMTHLRNIVFNCSIKSTKKVIDAVCDNFEKATKREQFKSSIQRIYSDITR